MSLRFRFIKSEFDDLILLRHGLLAELDENNTGVLIVNLDGQPTGAGRVVHAGDITRGLETSEQGCVIM